jgi:hypothetical protein
MATTQPQTLLFTPPAAPYRVEVPVDKPTPSQQASQQLTMCFRSRSRAEKFQGEQAKQIERYEKRQKEMERELQKQKKKTKKYRSHYGFRFGNVGNVQYSPSVSL